MWQVSTTRSGWTNAAVTLRYTDSEISGLTGPESGYAIYQASSPAGPWSLLSGGTVDTARNLISAPVTSLGYFAIASANVPVALSSFELD